MLALFATGGIFMWPILVCSILAFAIIFYSAFYLLGFHKRSAAFFSCLTSRGQAGSAVFIGMSPGDFSAITSQKMELAKEKVQLEFDKALRPLEFLAGLGGLAPLMGFMGTVSGMIISFRSIAEADKVSVKLVAGGISEALVTTGFGLLVAIACLFFESIFRYYLTARSHRATEEFTKAGLV